MSSGGERRALCTPLEFFANSSFMGLAQCTGAMPCWNRFGSYKFLIKETYFLYMETHLPVNCVDLFKNHTVITQVISRFESGSGPVITIISTTPFKTNIYYIYIFFYLRLFVYIFWP